MPAGAFITLGMLIAAVNAIKANRAEAALKKQVAEAEAAEEAAEAAEKEGAQA
jgi:hypothetical protein